MVAAAEVEYTATGSILAPEDLGKKLRLNPTRI
jgi:hypothetical protein